MYPISLSPAQEVDFALMLLIVFGALVLVALLVLTVLFIVKYNHKKHPDATQIEGNPKAEFIWTVIPTLMIFGFFYFGWTGYKALRTVPENAMHVTVDAKMFSWTFIYDNGKQSSELMVPVGQPVKVELHSRDVIHSFFVPAFRVKMDCVPGMTTYAWFKAEREGEYDILCAEYCGLNHSGMLAKIKAVSREEFDKWYGTAVASAGPEAGKAVLDAQGCISCHTLDGSATLAPSFKGMYGEETTVLTGGKKQVLVIDPQYIKDSIREPAKDIVDGFQNIMPPYDLSDDDINNIVEYLKTIGKDAKE